MPLSANEGGNIDTITIDAPTRTAATVPVTKARPATDVICPACKHGQSTRATTVKCGGCGLRAPISAFSGAVATRKFGAPRAFTIGGGVD